MNTDAFISFDFVIFFIVFFVFVFFLVFVFGFLVVCFVFDRGSVGYVDCKPFLSSF